MKPSRKHPKDENGPRILELKAAVYGSSTKNPLIEKVRGWQCVGTRPPKQLLAVAEPLIQGFLNWSLFAHIIKLTKRNLYYYIILYFVCMLFLLQGR